MAFPLIPVLVGAAAVAAAIIYFARNKSEQNRLTDAARDLGHGVQSGVDKVESAVSDAVGDVGGAAKKVESVVSDAVDDVGGAAKDAAAKLKKAAAKVID